MNIMNPTGLAATQAKIKPLIGFKIDIKCDTKLGMMYLARDRPKMIAKVNTNEPRGNYVGNKGMRQLCQTFRDMKSAKKMVLHLAGYQPQQLRILTKWLKTSRNLKTLQLIVPWGRERLDKSLIEILLSLKDLKSLNDLTLDLWRNQVAFRFQRLKPFMKLYHLRSLKKLKMSSSTRVESNPRHGTSILDCLEGLEKLCDLDLDVSFLNHLPEMEIQRSMEDLKEIRDLRSLRLDLRYCGQLGNLLIEELILYLTSLHKLESFQLICSTFAYLNFETIEKLIASVKNNPDLKSLVLLTDQNPLDKPEREQLQCLDLKTLSQLRSLKLSLSANSRIISNRLLQDTTEILKQNPLLETLDLELFLKPLNEPSFRLFCRNLQNLENLTSLRLSLSQTLESSDQEHIRDLARSLKNLKRLENLHLNFSSCAFSSKNVPLIAEAVESLQDLRILHLDFSNPPARFRDYISFLKKTGIGSFGPVFQNHKSLTSITLFIPGLKPSDQELEDLALGIEALRTLTRFEFSSSHLCPSLCQSFAKNPMLSCLILKFQEMKHQNMESLFEILQKAKNLKKLKLDFPAAQSLSERAVRNFTKMIQGLVKLRSMELSVFWDDKVHLDLILRFLDGMKYFEHFVDCSWQSFVRNPQDREKCENALEQNSKYLRYLPSPVRYRRVNINIG